MSAGVAVALAPVGCRICGRTPEEHGRPVILESGEMIIPACELLHPGGARAATEPTSLIGMRPLAKRVAIAEGMSLDLAEKLVGGPLGHPSKLPGYSYGLDAWKCHTGEMLSNIPGSVCEHCYARKNFYATWWPVKLARQRRHAALFGRFWVEGMIRLIRHHTETERMLFFRWHDSGDLQSWEHLVRIAAVCEGTPRVKHWLPTREYAYVAAFLSRGYVVPSNLAIRLSAHMVGEAPQLPFGELLAGLPTSTVHLEHGQPLQITARRRDSIECRAYTRENHCGPCRACWTPAVKNVSYTEH